MAGDGAADKLGDQAACCADNPGSMHRKPEGCSMNVTRYKQHTQMGQKRWENININRDY